LAEIPCFREINREFREINREFVLFRAQADVLIGPQSRGIRGFSRGFPLGGTGNLKVRNREYKTQEQGIRISGTGNMKTRNREYEKPETGNS
jgi:hypothetical protein